MTNAELKVVLYGIKVKIKRGGDLEEILASYANLTDEEKQYIRDNI